MALPKDPMILLSYVNTRLRDSGDSLEAFCEEMDTDRADLETTLAAAGFIYDPEKNQFR